MERSCEYFIFNESQEVMLFWFGSNIDLYAALAAAVSAVPCMSAGWFCVQRKQELEQTAKTRENKFLASLAGRIGRLGELAGPWRRSCSSYVRTWWSVGSKSSARGSGAPAGLKTANWRLKTYLVLEERGSSFLGGRRWRWDKHL